MGWGKILSGVAIGVGAVAAVPFTGGGSVLGAATLLGSLGTTGAVAGAVGAGVVGAAAGAALSEDEEAEKEALQKSAASAKLKAEKFENIANEHKEHTHLILALSALGISMANADGDISDEELEELNEFVGGLSSQKYPSHIVEQIEGWLSTPPSFNEALGYLKHVEAQEYPEIRNLLVMVMEADGIEHVNELAFLAAYDERVKEYA